MHSLFSGLLVESILHFHCMLDHLYVVLRREPTKGKDNLHLHLVLYVVPMAGYPILMCPTVLYPSSFVPGPNIPHLT